MSDGNFTTLLLQLFLSAKKSFCYYYYYYFWYGGVGGRRVICFSVWAPIAPISYRGGRGLNYFLVPLSTDGLLLSPLVANSDIKKKIRVGWLSFSGLSPSLLLERRVQLPTVPISMLPPLGRERRRRATTAQLPIPKQLFFISLSEDLIPSPSFPLCVYIFLDPLFLVGRRHICQTKCCCCERKGRKKKSLSKKKCDGLISCCCCCHCCCCCRCCCCCCCCQNALDSVTCPTSADASLVVQALFQKQTKSYIRERHNFKIIVLFSNLSGLPPPLPRKPLRRGSRRRRRRRRRLQKKPLMTQRRMWRARTSRPPPRRSRKRRRRRIPWTSGAPLSPKAIFQRGPPSGRRGGEEPADGSPNCGGGGGGGGGDGGYSKVNEKYSGSQTYCTVYLLVPNQFGNPMLNYLYI